MDIKEIVGKEIAGEDVSALVKDFSDDQKKEYSKTFLALAEEKKKAAIEGLAGIRKATEKITEEGKNKAQEEFQKTFRGEQVTKARNKIISELGITDADQLKKLDEEFAKEDSGKMDADFIIEDFKKAFVKINPDAFIAAKKKTEADEKAAADFIKQSAGGGGTGGGPGGDNGGKKYSPQAYQVVKDAHAQGLKMTLDQAEAGLKMGGDWQVRR